MVITSPQNEVFKNLKHLESRKEILKLHTFLLAGEKVIHDFFKAAPPHLKALQWVLEENSSHMELTHKHFLSRKPLVFSASLFKELDLFNTKFPLLLLEFHPLADLSELKDSEPAAFLATGDPSNLGAIVRSCHAFGIRQIVITEECALPFLPRAVRAAAGGLFSVQFFLGPSIHKLQGDFYALDLAGESLPQTTWPKNTKWLIGEEGQGVPEHLQVKRVHIPMAPLAESLNASVAAAIAFYDFRLKHPLQK